jgi:hypothetical protein
MKKPSIVLPLLIIVNACVWGLTILMVANTLKGTGAYQEIQHILGGGAGFSTVIVGGGMAGLFTAMKAKEEDPDAG